MNTVSLCSVLKDVQECNEYCMQTEHELFILNDCIWLKYDIFWFSVEYVTVFLVGVTFSRRINMKILVICSVRTTIFQHSTISPKIFFVGVKSKHICMWKQKKWSWFKLIQIWEKNSEHWRHAERVGVAEEEVALESSSCQQLNTTQ